MAEKPTYIYIFCFEDGDSVKGPCKIGITRSLAGRLAQVQCGSPHRMVLLGTLLLAPRELACDAEKELHRLLKDKRLNGEWFDIEPGQAAGVVAHLGRMLFEALTDDKGRVDELCEKTGAYDLIRFFHLSEGRRDLALVGLPE